MRYPSIDVLLTKIDSKYKLAFASAMRAKELAKGEPLLIDDPKCYKEVGLALEEIIEKKLDVEFE